MQKSSVDTERITGSVETGPGAGNKGPADGGGLDNRPLAAPEPSVEDMTREQLIEKLETVRDEASRNFDAYLRTVAELENTRKRHLRDREEMRKFSNEALVKNLLAVVDNMERAMVHSAGEIDSVECVAEGIELTLKGLMDILSKEGLAQVSALGKPFDPNFHEAVSETEDLSVDAGTVVHELQRGYLLNGRLIRPAKVVVSRKPN